MRTIMKIAESLVILNHWKVRRLDIQHFEHCNGQISGFCGYLDVEIENRIERIIIHDDGSFELKHED